MVTPVNRTALWVVRDQKGMTRLELSEKSGISISQITRLESGSGKPPRAKTLAKLSKALGVEPEQLTGEAPPESGYEAMSPKQQANFRIASSARNALGLVGMRYRVSPADIIEAAPLLFHLFAEGSLKARRDRLRLAEEKFALAEGEAVNFPHLPKIGFIRRNQTEDILAIEERSISDGDLFGESISKELEKADIGDGHEAYDAATDNPLVSFLRQQTGEWGVEADVQDWGAYSGPRFTICEKEALEFVGGDESAANAILIGSAPLTEMPDNLRKPNADPAKRAEWANDRHAHWLKEIPDYGISF